jgi:endonuclease/exonuclease/phosphatase family metal-dependent hydrolase
MGCRAPHLLSSTAVLAVVLSSLVSCSVTDAQETPERSAPTSLLVGTFNVHYIPAGREGMEWERRRDAVVSALKDAGADIVGFQEMETFAGGAFNTENRQLAYLREQLPGYRFGSVGDPAEYPSTQPIMYRADRFELLNQGFFFFSDTPGQLYSRSWDGRFPAYCSWSRLQDLNTGEAFYVYNVHFDAGSRGNRVKAAELVRARIRDRQHQGEPVVLLGDLNAPWFFRPARILRSGDLTIADTEGPTYHFYRGIDLLPAIDHLLVSRGFEAERTWVLRKKYGGVWPSDHYPVIVEVSYASQ